MSLQRRRACEECHVAKTRCELSLPESRTTPPCQRCRRIGRDCVPSAPRRQRNKIAQLEAQVNELSRALQKQEGLPPEPHPVAEPEQANLDLAAIQERSKDYVKTDILAFLDARLPLDLQQTVCNAYVEQAVPRLPLVPLVQTDVPYLRQHSPALLLSILAFTTVGLIESDVQYQLAGKAMDILATSFIAHGHRSLELVQALLVASVWFPDYSGAGQAIVHQLMQIANEYCH